MVLTPPDNLKRWGIRKTNKYVLCKNPSNLQHTLNWCPKALTEGRFSWRHNIVLSHLATNPKKNKTGDLKLYADLPEFWLNGRTFPPDVLCTPLRPDLVILDRKTRSIELLECTCSFECNIESGHFRKARNYNDLNSDLEKNPRIFT